MPYTSTSLQSCPRVRKTTRGATRRQRQRDIHSHLNIMDSAIRYQKKKQKTTTLPPKKTLQKMNFHHTPTIQTRGTSSVAPWWLAIESQPHQRHEIITSNANKLSAINITRRTKIKPDILIQKVHNHHTYRSDVDQQATELEYTSSA